MWGKCPIGTEEPGPAHARLAVGELAWGSTSEYIIWHSATIRGDILKISNRHRRSMNLTKNPIF